MTLQQHYNPVVFDRKTVFMQRLADFVRLGYRHYVLGEVRPDRAWALASKFRRFGRRTAPEPEGFEVPAPVRGALAPESEGTRPRKRRGLRIRAVVAAACGVGRVRPAANPRAACGSAA